MQLLCSDCDSIYTNPYLYIKVHKIQALKYIKIAYYCVLTLKNTKK